MPHGTEPPDYDPILNAVFSVLEQHALSPGQALKVLGSCALGIIRTEGSDLNRFIADMRTANRRRDARSDA